MSSIHKIILAFVIVQVALVLGQVDDDSQCVKADWRWSLDRSGWSVCPQKNTYLKGLWRHNRVPGDERVGRIEFGGCCTVGAARPDQPAVCNNANWWSTLDRNYVWALCPDGYFLNGLYKTYGPYLYNIEEGQCCRPQNQQEVGYDDCFDEDVSYSFNNRGWSECQREGYYMTGIYKSNCEHIYCIEKFKCCRMKTTQADCGSGCEPEGCFSRRCRSSCKSGERHVSIFDNRCSGEGKCCMCHVRWGNCAYDP